MNYMLVLNKELFFFDESILNNFCKELQDSSYDENTRIGNRVFTEHLQQAFEADKRLTNMVRNHISEDLVPVVSFEFCNTCDLNKFDFFLASTDENRKVLKREELLFYEYCDVCFGYIQGLLFKLNQALPD